MLKKVAKASIVKINKGKIYDSMWIEERDSILRLRLVRFAHFP